MVRRSGVPLVVSLLLLMNLSCLTRTTTPEALPPLQARLELAAGEVTLLVGDTPTQVYSGAALPSDARIQAGDGARAQARLADGSAIFLRGGTLVQLGSDEVVIEAGEIWLDAPPTDAETLVYRVGAVTISATDAGLSIRKGSDDVTTYVARGLAVVSTDAGRVEVQAGEKARITGKGAPEVSPVSYWEDWTGGMADNRSVNEMGGGCTGVLYGVDPGAPAGSAAQPLDLRRLAVRSVIRSELAETEVDQTFVNHGERDMEGWYWFAVPPGATVTSFAVENQGVLVEGEFIEQQEASAKYTQAASTGYQPAILEWIDSQTFRARIYPVPAMGHRRIVLRYLEHLPVTDGVLRYHYPLQGEKPTRIGEFSLSVDLGEHGTMMDIATLADARVEDGGRLVTMRRSGFTPRADFQLEAKLHTPVPPLRVSRYATGPNSADYVMVRYTPDIAWHDYKNAAADVVVVVDTSAAGDETSRHFKMATAEAILRALSDEDRFALVSLDVESKVLHPMEGLAPVAEDEITAALESLADHSTGGATDLAAFFDVALGRLHEGDQPAVIYVGDGQATSGELTGDQLRERLRRALSTSPARLFTVAVGTDANHTLLNELARTGGGQAFRVDNANETTERALRLAAAIKTPTITELEIGLGPGLDDVFVSGGGKVSHGDEVILLARTHHELPEAITITGKLTGKDFSKSYEPVIDDPIVSTFVPRFWAQEFMKQLLGAADDPLAVRGEVAQLGINYGLMTPYTSILALESEAAYAAMGITRRGSPLQGVRLVSVSDTITRQQREQERQYQTDMLASMGEGAATSTAVADTAKRSRSDHAAVESVEERATSSARPGTRAGVGRRAKTQSAPAPTVPEVASIEYEEPSMSADYGDVYLDDYDDMSMGGAAAQPQPIAEDLDYDRSREMDRVAKDVRREEREHREPARYNGDPLHEISAIIAGAMPLTCSDWASRPLTDRLLQWEKRLKTAAPGGEILDRYVAAKQACELNDWRSESAFLRLMARYVDTEAEAMMVLDAFWHDRATQKYLARELLRGSTDERLVDAVRMTLFGDKVNWAQVDLELSAIEDLDARIEACRQFMTVNPDDPEGTIRLIRLLAKTGRQDEMLVLCRRLQDRGMMTPLLAREMGDLMAMQGFEEEAVRAYSEIVEFQADSPRSRQLLGDIYLANGWYSQAYRQYKTVTETSAEDSLCLLRLAAAAAGQGRVDEALRIERKVASAPGMPGPDDPRGWARLASAARLVRLLDTAAAGETDAAVDAERMADSLRRKLKELQLFRAPGTLVILSWEDLDADFALATYRDYKEVVVGNPTDAHEAGLAALLLPSDDLGNLDLRAQLRSVPTDRDTTLVRHDIVWDGESFEIEIQEVELAAGDIELML